MNARADLVTLVQRLPRVFLHLFHAETDATRPWIDTQHFNLDTVTRVDDFARMLHTLGPAHLRDVDQPFNTRLELDKRAVVGNARHPPAHARTNGETFLDAGP